jgi:hypothetical protein
MAIDLSGIVGTIPPPAAPLKVTLPGGLVVEGVTEGIAADALTQARAMLAAANPALAPLGPVFSIIDALLAVKKFAEAVPDVLTNPGKVVEGVTGLVGKIGKLATIIPQLSVPLMLLGVVDLVIGVMNGLATTLDGIADQEDKIVEARDTGTASSLPDLIAIADQAQVQMDTTKESALSALDQVEPLVEIINIFCDVAGLPKIVLDVDTSGSTREAADAFRAAADVLLQFRATIPV